MGIASVEQSDSKRNEHTGTAAARNRQHYWNVARSRLEESMAKNHKSKTWMSEEMEGCGGKHQAPREAVRLVTNTEKVAEAIQAGR